MKEAVGYLRVSGEIQVKGSGYGRQQETIELYANQNQYRIVQWYKEAHTGTEEDRPVFFRMIEDLLSNSGKIILIECMDRFARDLTVQSNLIALLVRKEILLISAMTGQDATQSKDPMLKALIQMQGVFAELEKNLLVRRLQKGRESARLAGRPEGRKPFGFHEEEKPVLKRIKQLNRKPRNRKRLGYYQIARILNEEGPATRTGKRWTGPTVKGIVSRGFELLKKE